ncbi:hypothetical protein CROQUDRAFT_94927 [Cronartium quercuum f. sp. fusiforme G11]|uniref:Uncharacterized protein n=1 Tax=Cronartium quercuum f. sp. fusiforme G11 TaxID=708437 RepID=A0A9P6TAE3_9BASI|nr:hypothetical protein CROQUDRAFT_94927 [Cronartium quercuum f. sp. fusiforme G11]
MRRDGNVIEQVRVTPVPVGEGESRMRWDLPLYFLVQIGTSPHLSLLIVSALLPQTSLTVFDQSNTSKLYLLSRTRRGSTLDYLCSTMIIIHTITFGIIYPFGSSSAYKGAFGNFAYNEGRSLPMNQIEPTYFVNSMGYELNEASQAFGTCRVTIRSRMKVDCSVSKQVLLEGTPD